MEHRHVMLLHLHMHLPCVLLVLQWLHLHHCVLQFLDKYVLVVIVHTNAQHDLDVSLADNVLVQSVKYLARCRQQRAFGHVW